MTVPVKEALLELGGLPGNVALAHHNAVAGRDEWRDAAAVIVIGRTQAPPSAVERIAEALTGRAVPALDCWYERADAVREMADGTSTQADADRHPDPLAELIRWQVCEGQVVQIIGRGRGVRRTADNSVHVLVLTDVPLPMPLAGTLDAAEMEPGPSDLMLAEGGVVLGNARHAWATYPGLWPSHNAADLAMRRSPSFPYRDTSIRERRTPRQDGGGLVEVAYQVAGAGQKPAKAWYDPLLRPDPAAFLMGRLGKLAWCNVGDVTPPKPPDPPQPDPPPAPRPPPPSPPAADDEPPPGHPAWDRPPLDELDGWEIAEVLDVDMPAWNKAAREERDGGEVLKMPEKLISQQRQHLSPVRRHGENQPAREGGASLPVLADDLAPAPRTIRTPENMDTTPANRTTRIGEKEASAVLVCDAPWLHPEVPAYPDPGGGTALLCPYCARQHRHGGFGHRLAHCVDPRGRGYVLVQAGTAPPWAVHHAPITASDRDLQR